MASAQKKTREKFGGMWKKGLMQLLVLGGQGHSANVYRCMIIFRELLWVGKQISCSKFDFMTIITCIYSYLFTDERYQ